MSVEIEAAKNWANPGNFGRTEWGDVVEKDLFAKLFVGRALYYYERQVPTRKYDKPENGMDETGFDCSGFITRCLTDIGWGPMPHIRHARNYLDHWGTLVQLGRQKAGDLVFFSRGDFPDHIGLMIDSEQVLHAATSRYKNLVIEPLDYISIPLRKPSDRFVSNPLGFKRMVVPQGLYTGIIL